MKASPFLISWHNDNTPIYSAHFEPHGKGRLATGGGDNNVRLWRVDRDGEERTVTYLTTLIKVGTPKTVITVTVPDIGLSTPKPSTWFGLPLEVLFCWPHTSAIADLL